MDEGGPEVPELMEGGLDGQLNLHVWGGGQDGLYLHLLPGGELQVGVGVVLTAHLLVDQGHDEVLSHGAGQLDVSVEVIQGRGVEVGVVGHPGVVTGIGSLHLVDEGLSLLVVNLEAGGPDVRAGGLDREAHCHALGFVHGGIQLDLLVISILKAGGAGVLLTRGGGVHADQHTLVVLEGAGKAQVTTHLVVVHGQVTAKGNSPVVVPLEVNMSGVGGSVGLDGGAGGESLVEHLHVNLSVEVLGGQGHVGLDTHEGGVVLGDGEGHLGVVIAASLLSINDHAPHGLEGSLDLQMGGHLVGARLEVGEVSLDHLGVDTSLIADLDVG